MGLIKNTILDGFSEITNQTAGSSSASEMPSPLVLLALPPARIYCAKLWGDDLRAAETGRTVRGGFAGATPAPSAPPVQRSPGRWSCWLSKASGDSSSGSPWSRRG